MMFSLSSKLKEYQRRLFIILCILLTLLSLSIAQNRQANRRITPKTYVLALAFSPDGQTLAISWGANDSVQRPGQIDLWNVETGKIRRTINGFDGPVLSVAFSLDSQTLISGSREFRSKSLQNDPRKGTYFTEIKWWDVQTGELKFKQTNPTNEARTPFTALSNNGEFLANAEYYTQINHIYSSIGDAANSGFSMRPQYSIQTNVVNLNLLNAQTGKVNVELKGVLKSSSSLFYRRLFTLPGFGSSLIGPVFSPVDNLVAVGMSDEIKVWNARTGSSMLKLKNFKGNARAVAFSPDGRVLAVASVVADSKREERGRILIYKSELNFYESKTGRLIKKLNQDGSVFSLAFMRETGGLIIGLTEPEERKIVNSLKYLEIETGKVSQLVNKTSDTPLITMSPNQQMATFINNKTGVILWDLKENRAKFTFEPTRDEKSSQVASRYILDIKKVVSVSFSGDGKTIAAGTEGNEIKLWDPRTGAVKKKLVGHEGAVVGVAISSDGKSLVSNDEETIRLWDTESETNRQLSADDAGLITSTALSPDGKTVAGTTEDSLLLWDVQSGELRQTFELMSQSPVNKIIFSSNGKSLLTADENGLIRVWDIETGEPVKAWETGGKISSVSLSPNERILVSATDRGILNIWDFQTGGLIKKLDKHNMTVNSLAFSADGKWMASGGDDRKIFVWDTSNWKSEHTMKGLDLTVTSLAFSPDGKLLASGSGNMSVVLWEVESGKLDRILK